MADIPLNGIWFNNQPAGGTSIQGGGGSLQGGGGSLQGGTNPQQAAPVQQTANPNNFIDPVPDVAIDPTFTAQQAAAAAQAAKAGALRSEVTNLVNNIKDIFNSQYGQVDASAGEQVGKLNDRFANESGQLTRGIQDETNAASAAFAGRGTRDSSDYGNSVDTITREGNNQITSLGQELQDNIAKIAAWVSQNKAGFDAQKSSLDTVLQHLNETTDPAELSQLKATLEGRIADLQASSADNNTQAQNVAALSTIAPSNARATSLKTTLAQIVNGNGDANQKQLIGERLIASAGLSPDEAQKLAMAFQSDLSTGTNKDKQTA